MKLSDFDFDLPEALIATRPARPAHLGPAAAGRRRCDPRSACVRSGGCLPPRRPAGPEQHQGHPGAPDRRSGGRPAQGEVGAKVEMTLLEPARGRLAGAGQAAAQAGCRRGDPVFRQLCPPPWPRRRETDLRLVFNLTGEDFDAALAEAGAMPLPPYIAAKRAPDAAGPDGLPDGLCPPCRGSRRPHRLACTSTRRCCAALAAKGRASSPK